MKQKHITLALSLALFTTLAFTACNNIANNTEDTVQPSDTTAVTDSVTIVTEETETVEPTEETKPENTSTTEKKSNTVKNNFSGGKETLYISTYGANGKVWGHVTMNGNTGRGTIHDDEENSYSITVKRHGGELHGVDQNGRHYVFKM
ncbi:MAG: hypothetical protein J6X58_07530 [Bacteroidales bacterium]|nr:hypothetical protein [Bacteroidales bacterium]